MVPGNADTPRSASRWSRATKRDAPRELANAPTINAMPKKTPPHLRELLVAWR